MIAITDEDRAWMREFGRRLNARMEQLDISKNELSKITGIDLPHIYSLVYGTHIPLATTVLKLSRALNMSVNELIDF
jgi:transcriptional regulator with XRE-family HTH domain